jgi:ABC-type multidrug transport system fused ATPase/permease subunit
LQNPYFSLLGTAWRYARAERKRYVAIYALFLCANFVYGSYPLLLGWFIDKIQRRQDQIPHYVLIYAVCYVGLKLLEWSFHGPARIMERQLAFNLSRNFLNERYHQALHLPVKWHQDHHSGSTINRIRKAYEALRGFFEGGFTYVYAISRLAVSFTAMLIFAPLFGGIGAALGMLTIYIIIRFDGPIIRTQEEVNEAEHVVAATLFDSLSNIMTVVTLRLEQSMERGLAGKIQRLLGPFRRNTLINEWKWFAVDTLVAMTYCVIVAGYVFQHWTPGKLFLVGSLVTLLGYVNQFTSVFHDLAAEYNRIVQYNTDVRTADGIEQAFREQHRADEKTDLALNWQTLELGNLNFSHRASYSEEHAPQSLHNLHIKLQRGKRIALIGESGSGKSTLLALLRGLYEPEPGSRLLVDGRESSLASLNETVTLFPQDPEIFENTIAYNLTLDLPFAPADIDAACRASYFSEVVKELPRGLESSIQERGVNLSGGQKQRLALARGILAAAESDVVLLDEPTSSVDPKTEALIYQRLFQAFSEKAMVSALHRLHLLHSFDYIYVLEQGRVVAEGTLAQLRQTSAEFQELWRHQEDAEQRRELPVS